jgi:hypothetical protein
MAEYTEVTLEIPVSKSLWPAKIPHVLLCDPNWTSAVRSKEKCQTFHAFLTLVSVSMNGRPHTRFWSYIQSNYERNSLIWNDTGNNSGALRTSNLCQSIQKLSKFRFKWLGYCRCALLQLDVSRLANGYTHNNRVGVPFGWRRKRHCSCAKRISRTIWQGTMQQILHLRWVQGIRAREVHLRRQVL